MAVRHIIGIEKERLQDMSDSGFKIKEITERYSTPKTNISENSFLLVNEKSLYIFFSVDICNSTKLKANNAQWFKANKLLYGEKFESMHFWKFNGDEVLYAEPFSGIEMLIGIVESSYRYLKNLENALFNAFSKVKIPLKGTIWIAETDLETKKNLHFKVWETGHEFLGIHIDEGFRLSKKISGSKIVLDPKIVYLFLATYHSYQGSVPSQYVISDSVFYKYARGIQKGNFEKLENIINNTVFVGYTTLNGVWANRLYPVFWYYINQKDYKYDEQLDNGLIIPEKLVSSATNATDWLSQLENIIDSVGISDEIKHLLSAIAAKEYKSTYSLENYSRLYYAIACVNPTSGKILIARRSNQRKHLRGVWEFIPFKHTSTAICQFIEKRFFEEFGIGIHVITDKEPENNPIPLHFCTIYRNGRAHNSLLCMAVIEEGRSDEELLALFRDKVDKSLYTDFRFVSSGDTKKYSPITMEEIMQDSINALTDNKNYFDSANNRITMYFPKSVIAVLSFYKRSKNDTNGDAWFHR